MQQTKPSKYKAFLFLHIHIEKIGLIYFHLPSMLFCQKFSFVPKSYWTSNVYILQPKLSCHNLTHHVSTCSLFHQSNQYQVEALRGSPSNSCYYFVVTSLNLSMQSFSTLLESIPNLKNKHDKLN